ncbi:MAG: ABC transporter ATP-binding protein [Bdellovibrionota bacterium]|nr:ABC transporter ATP-binding protein [Bdellovibrionota bacterium]
MENAIEVNNLTKEFAQIKAVSNMTFSVKKGSIHGFLGPNGSGKSTTMNLICGLLVPNSGEILIGGKKIETDFDQLKRSIGFLPEDPPLYKNMLVEEYIKFVAGIRGVPNSKVKKRVETILAQCGLEKVKRRRIGNLSLGYTQKVGVAQALVHDPDVVLLDEPTRGLDPEAVDEMRKLIKELKGERTLLLSSHLLNEVQNLCSEITIIKEGQVIQNGSLSEIRSLFQQQRMFKAEVRKFNEEIYQAFRLRFGKVVNLNFEKKKEEKSEEYSLNLKMPKTDDLRSEVCNFLVDKKCGLLSFSEESIGVEEIFRLATAEGNVKENSLKESLL